MILCGQQQNIEKTIKMKKAVLVMLIFALAGESAWAQKRILKEEKRPDRVKVLRQLEKNQLTALERMALGASGIWCGIPPLIPDSIGYDNGRFSLVTTYYYNTTPEQAVIRYKNGEDPDFVANVIVERNAWNKNLAKKLLLEKEEGREYLVVYLLQKASHQDFQSLWKKVLPEDKEHVDEILANRTEGKFPEGQMTKDEEWNNPMKPSDILYDNIEAYPIATNWDVVVVPDLESRIAAIEEQDRSASRQDATSPSVYGQDPYAQFFDQGVRQGAMQSYSQETRPYNTGPAPERREPLLPASAWRRDN